MKCPKCNKKMKCYTTFRLENNMSKRWYRCPDKECDCRQCTTEVIDNGSLIIIDQNKVKVVKIDE